ncbi:MucR family transcriptional regulator, partial [Pseudomonas aeruginosa]
VSVACLAPYDPMLGRTAQIVMAYVERNAVPVGELPGLIASVHAALVGLTQRQRAAEPEVAKRSPADIKKSITPDALISFIDGK